ncbi:apolipoprotein N-acyltransferase [Sphingomonas sp. Leaf343]|uniref:apolipoprotein N-acyltransferase n=1 Tax=Sphingomonas sp. Leaf343 TaxID=1736345 RepID=UPI0006F44E8E|nr:apolipoprotein N-acyltransferase [Sphingomonas sp. Leaf343]KQR84312.1 acyltransferase [Sphingomonas sp. Leaf343]
MLRSPALLSVLLGAVAACGFAPLELWPLTLGCFAAWLLLVHRAPTFRNALWRGWLFGLGHFTVNNNWFQHAFDFQDAMPPVLGYFAAVGLALYLAVYPMMAAGIAWRFRQDRADAAFVLIFAAAWIATEYLRAVMFTGYAWNALGVLWVPVQAVASVSAWVGTYALSGLTIAFAGVLLLLWQRRWWWALPVLAVPLALQPLSYRAQPPTTGSRVRVVQPNIGQQDRNENDGERVFRALAALSGEPGPIPRLIVWPEGMLRDLIEDDYPAWIYTNDPARLRRRIAALLGPRDVLMTGGIALSFDAEDRIAGAANSVFAIDARARLIGRYDKAHLVPYGEYLPLPWLLRPLGLSQLVPGDLDFSPGPGPHAIEWPGFGPVGIQVCYEIIFSGEVVDEAHRPKLLFNPSTDAWFGKWGPPQHLAQARMRAIEEGLPIVRSTPTGISAIIAADGTLLATVPHERAGAIELAVPPALPPTLFSRIGNVLAAMVASAMGAAAIAIRRRGR